MTFLRPLVPFEPGGLGSNPTFPTVPRPGGNPNPYPVYEWAREHPEVIHTGVGVLVTQLVPPPARRVARMAYEVVHFGGHVLWDRASDWFPNSESSESSSSVDQQNGGSGGTPPYRRFENINAIPAGSRVNKPSWKTTSRHSYGGTKSGYHYCKKGWFLVRVGDTNMCWKPPRK